MVARDETSGLKVTLAVYVLVLVAKLVAYWLTGVMALLGEALHTLSDVLVSAFLLAATLWSRKEANEVHMFGYGRAQSAGALVAATIFISFTSLRLFEEAIPRLLRPEQAGHQNLGVALGVIVGSMVLSALPLVGLLKQRERGAAAKAQLLGLVNDELGLVAALVGTLLILAGRPIADPIATIAVAIAIAVSAIELFRENLCLLLGRSPGQEYVERLKQVVLATPGVLGLHDVRVEEVGPGTVHAGLHVEVHRGLPIEEADRIAEQVHARLHTATDGGYCVIHVDPAPSDQATIS